MHDDPSINLSEAAKRELVAMFLKRFPDLLHRFKLNFEDDWQFPDLKSPSALRAAGELAAAKAFHIFDYITLLDWLASREIPPLVSVEVLNDGLPAWERSREEHRVAHELKAFAIEELAGLGDESHMEPNQSLDEFLAGLMPKLGVNVRVDRFKNFLEFMGDCDTTVDVSARWDCLEMVGVPDSIQSVIEASFHSWWKNQSEGSGLALSNNAKQSDVQNRLEKIAKLLPSRRVEKGMDKQELKMLCISDGLFTSDRSLTRDLAKMVKILLADRQENGKFRQHREKK